MLVNMDTLAPMLIVLHSWRNAKFIAMDANFAQKARLRPNDPNDPPLGPSFANFVDYKPYAEHLKNYIHKEEVRMQLKLPHLSSIVSMYRLAIVSALLHYGMQTRKNPQASGQRALDIGMCSSSNIPGQRYGRSSEGGTVRPAPPLPPVPVLTLIRYANMDYLFWSHIMCTYWTVWLLCLRLSYDIACQFGGLLFERLKALPS
jgi:hypothetical protein